MSRNIVVSTDVFAAIWAARMAGEDSEDAILRRVLGCRTNSESLLKTPSKKPAGVFDSRNSIEFNRGFEIFRSYKGKLYKASAIDGAWLREDNGRRYTSLNQLNASIVDGNENVWNGNWRFRTAEGEVKPLNTLRNPTRSDEVRKDVEFDQVWTRVLSMEGETFRQVRGGEFTYRIAGSSLELDRTNQNISKSQLREAFDLAPLKNTVPLQHLRAPSYLFAIIMDKRIRAKDW